VSIADLVARRRPARADAQRNYDALLVAARAAFTQHGTDASLEDIARRAGVGIATLYRNFPTREVLIESVYVAEIGELEHYLGELADLPPREALVAWLRRFITSMATKYALIDGLNSESDAYKLCRDALYEMGGPLLESAQAAGEVRDDVTIDDVMRFMLGVTSVNMQSDTQRDRIIDMTIAGLRPA
jgi:AcrR family transcriptional regulator